VGAVARVGPVAQGYHRRFGRPVGVHCRPQRVARPTGPRRSDRL